METDSGPRKEAPGEARFSYLVFVDVDETLIRGKSLFDFLRFQLIRRFPGEGEQRYQRIRASFDQAVAAGATREELNRDYYRLYAGEPARTIADLGEMWFTQRRQEGALYIEEIRGELTRHQAAGAGVVLVSGSFSPCLAPIARDVDALDILCTAPLVRDGKYTGEIHTPVIGKGKRDAVLRYLAQHPQVRPSDCHAYGDDPSDIPMLQSVGHPHMVDDNATPARDPRLTADPH